MPPSLVTGYKSRTTNIKGWREYIYMKKMKEMERREKKEKKSIKPLLNGHSKSAAVI